jgi:hypothetical protein
MPGCMAGFACCATRWLHLICDAPAHASGADRGRAEPGPCRRTVERMSQSSQASGIGHADVQSLPDLGQSTNPTSSLSCGFGLERAKGMEPDGQLDRTPVVRHACGHPLSPPLPCWRVIGGLFAQQALQQADVGRISETQPSELPDAKPLDGVVLLWLHVRDYSAPAARHPDSEVQASIGNDTVQYGRAVNALQRDPQFLGYFPPERILRPFLRFDMPAREVPHVWIPPPRRRPVTQQQPICLPQDHGHDAMACHSASVTVSHDACQARTCQSTTPAGRTETTMMACPALFPARQRTLMARQGAGGLGRVLGSVRTDPLTWLRAGQWSRGRRPVCHGLAVPLGWHLGCRQWRG